VTAVYLAIGFALAVATLIVGAFHYGKKDLKSDISEEALKRAKQAKDVRSGDALDDKWLRPRD
jgi:hypothetical protein